MEEKKTLVSVIMGSTSDSDIMTKCMDVLNELEVPYEVRVLSAHRTPDLTRKYVLEAPQKGVEVFIAGAGWAAHLAGMIAASTVLPVIGIPIDSSPLKGMDALLATVQMPPGIPVATVAIGGGGAKNAAVLAAQILALKHPEIAERLRAYRSAITENAAAKSESWSR
jgi:phosphoribosylaminoimidazole carboxylase PurE protein